MENNYITLDDLQNAIEKCQVELKKTSEDIIKNNNIQGQTKSIVRLIEQHNSIMLDILIRNLLTITQIRLKHKLDQLDAEIEDDDN